MTKMRCRSSNCCTGSIELTHSERPADKAKLAQSPELTSDGGPTIRLRVQRVWETTKRADKGSATCRRECLSVSARQPVLRRSLHVPPLVSSRSTRLDRLLVGCARDGTMAVVVHVRHLRLDDALLGSNGVRICAVLALGRDARAIEGACLGRPEDAAWRAGLERVLVRVERVLAVLRHEALIKGVAARLDCGPEVEAEGAEVDAVQHGDDPVQRPIVVSLTLGQPGARVRGGAPFEDRCNRLDRVAPRGQRNTVLRTCADSAV